MMGNPQIPQKSHRDVTLNVVDSHRDGNKCRGSTVEDVK